MSSDIPQTPPRSLLCRFPLLQRENGTYIAGLILSGLMGCILSGMLIDGADDVGA